MNSRFLNNKNFIDLFIQLLGADAVLVDDQYVQEFRDPYEVDSKNYQPSCVIQPSTVEEVQQVVKIANEKGIHLWTSSMGRNFGYGGSAPVVNGSVVLNLRRMNKILEINEEAGYVLIEPGVSFFDLYNELKSRGSKLMMSVPDLGWGSIIGNTLEHGYGYTVNGDHASTVCGMEVVLASGEVLRTGQGAIEGSNMWQRHKRGFGPSLDSLFMQSNFGIVTKMGIWLMPQPEVFTTGFITYHDDDATELIDTLRPLVMDGTIQGYPLIIGSPKPVEGWINPLDNTAGMSKQAKLSAILPSGRWNARISFYGPKSLVQAREAIVRNAISQIQNVTIEMRSYTGDVRLEDVHPEDLVPAGIPNMFLLDMMKKHFGETIGHIDFSPVIPFTGEAVARLASMVEEILAERNLVAPIGLIANSRSLVGCCMLFFDTNNPEEAQAAQAAVKCMLQKAYEWGWSEYRAHVSLVEDVANKFNYNNQILSNVYSRLKDALDPASILSPGNHGIWSSNFRPLAHSKSYN